MPRIMGGKKKTAPGAGAELTVIGEPTQCSKAEFHRHILRGLLHYHERMMFGRYRCPGTNCETVDKCELEGKCPNVVLMDVYAEALKEAIRCIEIVHKDELSGA